MPEKSTIHHFCRYSCWFCGTNPIIILTNQSNAPRRDDQPQVIDKWRWNKRVRTHFSLTREKIAFTPLQAMKL
jgi:hypothetical protein